MSFFSSSEVSRFRLPVNSMREMRGRSLTRITRSSVSPRRAPSSTQASSNNPSANSFRTPRFTPSREYADPAGSSNERRMRRLSVSTLPAMRTLPTTVGVGTESEGAGIAAPGGTSRMLSGGTTLCAHAAPVHRDATRKTSVNRSVPLRPRSNRRRNCLDPRRGGEVELVAPSRDPHLAAARQLAAKDVLRKRVFQQSLDGSLERTRPERRVEPALDEQLDRLRADVEVNVLRT